MAFDKEYDVLASKFKLPAYKDLAQELDFSAVESDKFVLCQVRKCMNDRLVIWIDVLEDVLSPDQARSSSLYESHFFNDEERKTAFALFKRLMSHDRVLLEALVVSDEKADADAIRKVWQDWQELKKGVLVIVRKMRDSWQKDVAHEDYGGYLL